MEAIDMLQAKTNHSRLEEAIDQGTEREIVIARNGRPVAKLVSVSDVPLERRIGVARDLFVVPDDIDAHKQDVARLLLGESPAKAPLDEQG